MVLDRTLGEAAGLHGGDAFPAAGAWKALPEFRDTGASVVGEPWRSAALRGETWEDRHCGLSEFVDSPGIPRRG